jgi:5'-3' exonuclease
MGIDGLTKTIKKLAPQSINVMSYSDIASCSPRRVYGVDVSSYLYPSLCNSAQKSRGNHIREFLEMIAIWATVDVRLIFVFDGNTYSEAKRETLEVRSAQRAKNEGQLLDIIKDIHGQVTTEAQPQTTDLQSLGQHILKGNSGTLEQRLDLEYALRNYVSMSPDKIGDLIHLFQSVGATYIRARGEADFILASLYRHGHIDGVISEDTDMLTHGVGRLVRGSMTADMGRRGQLAVYSLPTLLLDAGLSMSQFIDLCILSGCDYCPKIRGVGSAIGLTLIGKYGSVEGILAAGTKYRPDCDTDLYLERYHNAVTIFTTEQEPLPSPVTLPNYEIDDVGALSLKTWLMSVTNYTDGTLDRKIDEIRRCRCKSKCSPEPTPEPVRAIAPESVKAEAERQPSAPRKIKVRLRQP